MGTINIKFKRKRIELEGQPEGETFACPYYGKSKLEGFGSAVLGLGDIGRPSRQTDVIAAAFDLSGFTIFCSQVDPHLSLPRFLKEFLNWLFVEIKSRLEIKSFEDEIALFSELPFFAKFTGDGVLFLWNTKNMDMTMICNIVTTLRDVCSKYNVDFMKKMRKHLSHVPRSLRCGVARGMVCSVGNRQDYVGPCINIASRLQKLSALGFCFSKRGIDFEEGMPKETAEQYVVKSMSIRGVGEDELVVVRKLLFEKLSEEDKALFTEV